MKNISEIKKNMENCRTLEELNKALKQAFVVLHPDNNLEAQEEATDAFIDIRVWYETLKLKLSGYVGSKKLEKEVARRNAVLRIRRNIQSADEFFSMDGTEQTAVLKGMSARVAIVLDGMTPTPNARQITDKHKADKNGNFDGVRSYAYVQYVFNKDKTINQERLEEVGQTAWIKLAENAAKEEYEGIPFYSLLWTSCRQAIQNLYNAEVRNAQWLDRDHDLYDLNAYETKAPTDSHTESNATFEIWLDGMMHDETDRTVYDMSKAGFDNVEIAEYIGMSETAVRKRLRAIHDRMNKDRMLEALNTTADKAGCRKNASASEIVRALIMQAIRNGISYKRIAYYLHCEVTDIPKLLVKGKEEQEVLQAIMTA